MDWEITPAQSRKSGMTLSEVVITMGISSVIAAAAMGLNLFRPRNSAAADGLP